MNHSTLLTQNRLPIGAELLGADAHFRVWVPRCRQIQLMLESHDPIPLTSEPDGYFATLVPRRPAGARLP